MGTENDTGKRWLKAEMHAHCNLDPVDYGICGFSPEQLLCRAAGEGFDVLAITCHNRNVWTDRLCAYARGLGITLVPGMEVTVENTRHVLVYNFDGGPRDLDTLEKIRGRSGGQTLVVAPHPYYPGRSCLRGRLEKNPDLFDAVEYSGFVVPGVNFNRRGVRAAARMGKPLLGCGDVHHLWQLGRTYAWIWAAPGVRTVLDAIRQGSVRLAASPISWAEAARWWARAALGPSGALRRPLPQDGASDKVEDGRGFGAAQEGMESQGIHIG